MSKIFEEVRFPHVTFKNHVARSATNDYAGNEDGTVSEFQMGLYRELAQGGVGMIITGHYAVCPLGRNDIHQNALWDDSFIASQRRLTDMVHENGSKIVAQINHAGAKAQAAAIGGAQPVAPSAVEVAPGVMPRALTAEEIAQVEDDFAAAALRAKQAGFDGVQVHCAHGYLFSQFIDPAHNKRADAYGGSVENRFRIVEETLRKVKAAVGGTFPVFIKIHCNAVEGDAQFASDLVYMLKAAAALGVEAAEISGFDFAKQPRDKRLYYMERARRAREASGLPVILVGGIRTLAEMDEVLDGGLDMVSLSRPFVCQPDILKRLQAGESSKCIGCFGCFSCYQKTGKRCVLH
ncbi:NADH:flavin oxidoreductase [Intestinibacillus massiliensis]|nr:NADH:flavin oxidoreductase [Intestinibacillus massiliensis]